MDTPIKFVTKAIKLQACYGAAVYDLQNSARQLCTKFLPGSSFVVMSGMFLLNCGPEHDHRSVVVPLSTNTLDVEKLENISRTIKATLKDANMVYGLKSLTSIDRKPSIYSKAIIIGGWSLSSFGVTIVFGGHWQEVLTATIISFFAAIINLYLVRKSMHLSRLAEPLSALVAAMIAATAVYFVGPMAIPLAVVCGLIVLMPGFSVTRALTEIALGHIVSGAGRLMAAIVTLLMLTVGVFLGYQFSLQLSGSMPGGFTVNPPSLLLTIIATIPSMIALGINFYVPRKHFPALIIAGIIITVNILYGCKTLESFIGAGVTALLLGLVCNIYSRWQKCSDVTIKVPCVMILVPGSVGFNGILTMLTQSPLVGIESGFNMFITAISIAVGLLLAECILPPYKFDR